MATLADRMTPTPAAAGARRLWTTLLIFAVALGLRLVHLHQLEGTAWADERALISDSQYYDMRAREIAGGELIGDYPGFLSPLYCYALGALYTISDSDLETVKWMQAILAALSVALVHRISRRLFSETASVLAALFLACYGPLIYYSALLLPTTLVLALHTLLIWILVRSDLSFRRVLFAGALIGLCIGAKANALLLLPAIGAWILTQHRDTPLAGKFRLTGCLLLGAVITIAPITWRNWATSGEFVLVTTTGGRNLLKGNGEQATGSHTSLNQPTVHIGHYLEGTVDIERAISEDSELAALAWETMFAHPGRAVQLFGTKLLLFFNRMEIGIRDDFDFARTQTKLIALPLPGFAFIAPLGLVGLLLWIRGNRKSHLLAWILLAQVASFVLVFVLARYRMVAVVCLAPFAGQAIAGFLSDIRTRRIARALAAAVLLVPAVLFVRLPLPGFEEPNPPGELNRFLADWHFEQEQWNRAFSFYNRAAKSAWQLSNIEDHWAVRARIAECYDRINKPQKAALVRESLLEEVMQLYPHRPLGLKTELRRELGLLPQADKE